MSLKQFILAATVATSAISAQASNTFKPEEISRNDPRFSGICEQVSKNAIDIIEWKNACEVSTDGGKTWIKAAGWASVLALSLVALARIRKAKKEKEKIADAELGDDELLEIPAKEFKKVDLTEETITPENEWPDSEESSIDPISEADVYIAYWLFEKATELLLEEIRKNPENTNAYLKLAEVYALLKEDAAINWLSREILSKFESSLSESELRKLIEAGNPDVQSTTETPKTRENIDLIDEATLYMANGRDEDAEAILLIAIKNDPEKIEAYTKLLELYYKLKNISWFQNIFMHSDAIHWMNNLPENDLIQAKAWGREIDPENPIYKELSTPTENVIPIEEAPVVQKIMDLGPDTIVPEIVPPAEDIVIVHEVIEPSAIVPSENIFPTQVIEQKTPIHSKFPKKTQWVLWIAPAVIIKLSENGFSIEKSEDGDDATIKVLKKWSRLSYLDRATNQIKTIEEWESYTITNATSIQLINNHEKIPSIYIIWKDWKRSYIQMIIE